MRKSKCTSELGDRLISISFTVHEWIEIETMLTTKIKKIQIGGYGPEDAPGEDLRWSFKVMRGNKMLSISLSVHEWIEIEAALATKVKKIETGGFGPEDVPGEDLRWMNDLQAIRTEINAHLFGRKKK